MSQHPPQVLFLLANCNILCMYVNKPLVLDGTRMTVRLAHQEQSSGGDGSSSSRSSSGVIGPHTQVTFRCRSARVSMLLQVSQEMWSFDSQGHVLWERCLDTVRSIFNRWIELGDDHHVTVLLFCRVVTHAIADSSSLSSLFAATPTQPELPPSSSKCSDYCRILFEGPVPKEPVDVILLIKVICRHSCCSCCCFCHRRPSSSSSSSGSDNNNDNSNNNYNDHHFLPACVQ